MLLHVHNVSKLFPDETLFQNISFTIQPGEKVSLIGPNGTGKTTLIQMIVGKDTPDSGSIDIARNTQIGYFAQSSSLESEHSIFHELFASHPIISKIATAIERVEQKLEHATSTEEQLSLADELTSLHEEFRIHDGYAFETKIKSLLAQFNLGQYTLDTAVATLSSGQKTRLALIQLLLIEPDLLILDEPTNHIDIDTMTWLEKYLSLYEKAVLLISHDRHFISNVTPKILEMTKNGIHTYHGTYESYLTLREKNRAIDEKRFIEQQKFIQKNEQFIASNIAKARLTKRAQSRRKMLDKLERLEKPAANQKNMHVNLDLKRDDILTERIFEMKNVTVGFEKPLVENISLLIKQNQKIAIIGENGIGKSTFIKTLLGELEPLKGKIKRAEHLRIGYFDQEQTTLYPEKRVFDHLSDRYPRLLESEVRTYLGSYLFEGDDVFKTVSMLSGGEKVRLLLALLSFEKPNVLILDEPTNNLDIPAKEVLEDVFSLFKGTLLVISHDRYFLNEFISHVIYFKNQTYELIEGNYTTFESLSTLLYLEKNKCLSEIHSTSSTQQKSTLMVETLKQASHNETTLKIDTRKLEKEERKQLQKERRSYEKMIQASEKHIELLEAQLKHITLELNSESLYEHPKQLETLSTQYEALESELAHMFEVWEDAQSNLEYFEKKYDHI